MGLGLPVLFVIMMTVPRIADGFELAAQASIKNLDKIADEFKIDLKDTSNLVKTAKTTLGSKIINKCHDKMANIAVDAIMAVADFETKDVSIEPPLYCRR